MKMASYKKRIGGVCAACCIALGLIFIAVLGTIRMELTVIAEWNLDKVSAGAPFCVPIGIHLPWGIPMCISGIDVVDAVTEEDHQNPVYLYDYRHQTEHPGAIRTDESEIEQFYPGAALVEIGAFVQGDEVCFLVFLDDAVLEHGVDMTVHYRVLGLWSHHETIQVKGA